MKVPARSSQEKQLIRFVVELKLYTTKITILHLLYTIYGGHSYSICAPFVLSIPNQSVFGVNVCEVCVFCQNVYSCLRPTRVSSFQSFAPATYVVFITVKPTDRIFYLPEDGLANLLLHQSAEPLHLGGHTGRPVDVSARRMVEAPIVLCQLRRKKEVRIYKTHTHTHTIGKMTESVKQRSMVFRIQMLVLLSLPSAFWFSFTSGVIQSNVT